MHVNDGDTRRSALRSAATVLALMAVLGWFVLGAPSLSAQDPDPNAAPNNNAAPANNNAAPANNTAPANNNAAPNNTAPANNNGAAANTGNDVPADNGAPPTNNTAAGNNAAGEDADAELDAEIESTRKQLIDAYTAYIDWLLAAGRDADVARMRAERSIIERAGLTVDKDNAADLAALRLLREGHFKHAGELQPLIKSDEIRKLVEGRVRTLDLLTDFKDQWIIRKPTETVPDGMFAITPNSIELKSAGMVWLPILPLIDYRIMMEIDINRGQYFDLHLREVQDGSFVSVHFENAPRSAGRWSSLKLANINITRMRNMPIVDYKPHTDMTATPKGIELRIDIRNGLIRWYLDDGELYKDLTLVGEEQIDHLLSGASGIGFELTADPEGRAEASISEITLIPWRVAPGS